MDNDQKKTCRGEENRAVAYDPVLHVRLAKKLRKLGDRDEGLAEAFNITVKTLSLWKSEYSEFSEACSEPPSKVAQVEEALFKHATGYTYLRQKPVNCDGVIAIAEYEEHVKGDLGAIMFLLMNLAPHKWKHYSKIVPEAPCDSPIAQFLRELVGTSIRPKLPPKGPTTTAPKRQEESDFPPQDDEPS